jgi:hypothetical protein
MRVSIIARQDGVLGPDLRRDDVGGEGRGKPLASCRRHASGMKAGTQDALSDLGCPYPLLLDGARRTRPLERAGKGCQ